LSLLKGWGGEPHYLEQKNKNLIRWLSVRARMMGGGGAGSDFTWAKGVRSVGGGGNPRNRERSAKGGGRYKTLSKRGEKER